MCQNNLRFNHSLLKVGSVFPHWRHPWSTCGMGLRDGNSLLPPWLALLESYNTKDWYLLKAEQMFNVVYSTVRPLTRPGWSRGLGGTEFPPQFSHSVILRIFDGRLLVSRNAHLVVREQLVYVKFPPYHVIPGSTHGTILQTLISEGLLKSKKCSLNSWETRRSLYLAQLRNPQTWFLLAPGEEEVCPLDTDQNFKGKDATAQETHGLRRKGHLGI